MQKMLIITAIITLLFAFVSSCTRLKPRPDIAEHLRLAEKETNYLLDGGKYSETEAALIRLRHKHAISSYSEKEESNGHSK